MKKHSQIDASVSHQTKRLCYERKAQVIQQQKNNDLFFIINTNGHWILSIFVVVVATDMSKNIRQDRIEKYLIFHPIR